MKKNIIILALCFFSTFCYGQKTKVEVTADKRVEWKIKTKKKTFEAFETHFELFDSAGNLVKKGEGKYIDCSDLKKGLYYLNYDNQVGEVINIK